MLLLSLLFSTNVFFFLLQNPLELKISCAEI
jgi:hypothetical protein